MRTAPVRGRIVEGFDMSDITYPHVKAKAGFCLWCGAESGFFKNGKPKKWCCDYCGTSGSSFRRVGRVAPLQGERSPRLGRCVGCGEGLEVSPRVRNPRKWCSESCRIRNYRKNNPEYVAQSKANAKARAAEREEARPRCENCGGELQRRREDWRFCGSSECRKASYLALKASVLSCSAEGCERPSHARGLCGSHYALAWKKRHPDRASQGNSRYRARKRAAFVEDVSPEALLGRDKWRCYLCGEKIPKNAVYPDPKSPSVDHIVPLSLGGKHEMANTAATHFRCNTVKNNRGGGEQLMLIG